MGSGAGPGTRREKPSSSRRAANAEGPASCILWGLGMHLQLFSEEEVQPSAQDLLGEAHLDHLGSSSTSTPPFKVIRITTCSVSPPKARAAGGD